MTDHPKLRQIEVLPAEVSGRQVIALRDPSGMTEKTLCLPPETAFILQFFDGTHSLLDIKAEYMRKFGNFLFDEPLTEIISQLDAHYLLENDHFFEEKKKIEALYHDLPVRPPSHAGKAYESEKMKLVRQLEAYFADAESRSGAETLPHAGPLRLTGFIAPHIDIQAGGPCFALAYAALARMTDFPGVFVILGTGHGGCENLFTLTRKDFETPLGRLRCDAILIDEMIGQTSTNFFSGELIHKTEHSIEFQVLFLQYLLMKKNLGMEAIGFVPVLCSFGPEDLEIPERRKIFSEFTAALRSTLEASGKPYLFIASVDLAHVGPRYGDPCGLAGRDLDALEVKDRETLNRIADLDADGFTRDIGVDRDSRKICGFAPIRALLDVLPPSSGTLLKYDMTRVDNLGSHVSYASMIFTPLDN